MAKSILIDTGFWYGLFSPRDEYHSEALEKYELFEHNTIVIPWPTLYETINTRFSKNPEIMKSFENFLKQSNVVKIDDSTYKDNAIELVFKNAEKHRPYALVDMVLREIISDTNIKIDYLFTFNGGDFYDVCALSGVEIV